MRVHHGIQVSFVVLIGLLCPIVWAESIDELGEALNNWPTWRGPLFNGVAPKANPPVHWSNSENVKWKIDLPGQSNATPIVWGNRVFVVSAVKSERTVDQLAKPKMEPPGGYRTKRPRHYYRFLVYCIDRESGDILWERQACERVPHEGHHGTNTYASGSPVTDGEHLYVSFGSFGLFCYDLDGHLIWERDLGDMITRYGWGEATSPALYGDSLAVNWDHEGASAVYVLDAATGATRWRTERNEETTWATPLIVSHRGRGQLILNGKERVKSYDLKSGRVIWECGGQTALPIPSPVVFEDSVICMTGYRGAAAYAIPLDATGDITDTDRIRWHYKRNTPYVPSPLLYGQRLYFTKGNRATLSCLDAGTGKVLMEDARLPDLRAIYASPLGAADRIYIVGRDGTTVVIKNQDKLDVLAVNKLDDPIDASPIAVGKELFLRSKGRLYCIAESLEPVVELPKMWEYSAPLIAPEKRADNHSRAQKDPTVVFYEGKWHVFMTVKLPGRSAIEYCSFADWEKADDAPRTILEVSDSDYYCASQVFYFEPHKEWYLVYQMGVPGRDKMWVAYSTTKDISDPHSWTEAQAMLDGGPDDPREVGGLDYWIICDDRRAYLFLTSLNGKMWRLWTSIEDFPWGFDHCELALEAKIFEASHTYKLKGVDRYLTVIEENGRRYYKAYVADRLDGEWTPLADTAERPFAGWKNIRPASGVQTWTDNVSHGELIRDGFDQTLTVDPKHLRFVFQGMLDKDKSSRGYGQFQWRIGMLTPVSD